MTIKQAIAKLSQMTKQEFNTWFDETLPERTKFIALAGGYCSMREICAMWYIKQKSKESISCR